MAISYLLYTNLQNKTLCWLLCTNLQNKTHYRRVTPFARSRKSQHKYIVSNFDWKLFPSIRHSRVGTKFRLEITLFNFWIKLRILTRKKHPKINSSAYKKYEYWYLDRWYIKLTLCKRFLNWNNFPKKLSIYWQNSTLCDRSILQSPFYLP